MPWLRRIYAWLTSTFGLEVTQLIFGAMVLVLGTMAFLFKKNYQPAYGIVELFFGFGAGVVGAKQLKPDMRPEAWLAPLATLIGSVYVVSRGWGNISDGLNDNRERNK